jgi:PAS domain S-box-containing protein
LPVVMLSIAAVYFAAGRLGLYFASIHASASPVWPPTGIALAALLLFGLRVWPAIFVGAWLVNVTTSGWPLTSLGIAGGNTLEAAVGAQLINRFANGPLAFERSQDIFKFAALASLLSTSVSATIGVASLALGGHAAWLQYTSIWLTWWLGDAVGTLVVAPFLLLWRQHRDLRELRRRPGEAVLLALAVLLTGWAVFGNLAPAGLRNAPVAFMCIPTLLWAVFRFGPPETATVVVGLSGLAVLGTLRGHGPFVGGTANESLLFLQAFMGTMIITMMPIASLVRESKRAAESLRDSEERSRVAIEAGEMGTWEWTVATDEVRWSPSLERIHGMVPGTFRGTSDAMLEEAHPDDRESLRRAAETALKRNGQYTVEYRIVRRDGAVRWVEARGRVLRDAWGRAQRMVGVCTDVTERRHQDQDRARLLDEERAARQRAEEAERRLAVLGDIASSITSSLELDTVLKRVAEGAKDLCHGETAALFLRDGASPVMVHRYQVGPPAGYPSLRIAPGQGLGGQVMMTGRPRRTGSYLEDPQVPGDFHEAAREAGTNALMVVPIAVQRQVEGLLYISNTSSRAFTDEDEAICLRLADQAAIAIQNAMLFALERALRAEAEQARGQADTANRAKDEFLTVLSHELRTPLNAVYGWARLLRNGQLDTETTARAIDAITRNAEAQSRLIDDLLDVSRIVAGKMRLEFRSVDLPAVIGAAVDAVRPAAESKEILLQTVLDPQAGPVQGDSDRLQQIVWNLLINAVKFTPKGGQIQLVVQRVKSSVEIMVTDTGLGIRPEVLPHIFERFHQGDSGSKRSQAGLGIGLALVRHLTELHGGTVSAESAGEGKGATFRVHLAMTTTAPIDSMGDHTAVGVPKPANTGPSLSGLRVLVVDDDIDALTLASTMLMTAGARVRTSTSAAEALSCVRSWRPHLLISDIEMPGEDGYELIRKVRALGPTDGGETPAIALTAYGRPEDRVRSVSAGYNRHVVKPVDPTELSVLIHSLMRSNPGVTP